MKSLQELVRPNILALKPYKSARDDFHDGILLDANENSFGSPFTDDLELNRYPMPVHEGLRKKIAEYRKIEPGNIFLGVGSDEAIDILMRIFCTPATDNIIITPPTYGMYKVSASIHDIQIKEVLLQASFQLNTDSILAATDSLTKIIFLCSPNNPTGNNLKTGSIEQILKKFDGIVVVDEAYIDFSNEQGFSSRLVEFPNLIVLQTMSKSFGMAGIRLGLAFASKQIIDLMLKVKAPYNINKLTVEYALRAFENTDRITKNISLIKEERRRLENALQNHPAVSEVYPSDSNFLLFKMPKAETMYRKLAEQGVIIRYRGNEPLCTDCLRLTVGSPEENSVFLEVFNRLSTSPL